MMPCFDFRQGRSDVLAEIRVLRNRGQWTIEKRVRWTRDAVSALECFRCAHPGRSRSISYYAGRIAALRSQQTAQFSPQVPQKKTVIVVCRSLPRSLYQQHLSFKRAKDALEALGALSQINLIAMHVQRSGRCRLLSFQTPYPLGPITRGVLCRELQPMSAFFNRQPGTWEPYPLLQRVTQGQVVLTTTVFLLFCAVQFLRLPQWSDFLSVFDFGDRVVAGLVLTVLVALFYPDVLGLIKSCGAFGKLRAMSRRLAEKKIPIGQDIEGNITASLSVAEMAGVIWLFIRKTPLVLLIVNLILYVLHIH